MFVMLKLKKSLDFSQSASPVNMPGYSIWFWSEGLLFIEHAYCVPGTVPAHTHTHTYVILRTTLWGRAYYDRGRERLNAIFTVTGHNSNSSHLNSIIQLTKFSFQLSQVILITLSLVRISIILYRRMISFLEKRGDLRLLSESKPCGPRSSAFSVYHSC